MNALQTIPLKPTLKSVNLNGHIIAWEHPASTIDAVIGNNFEILKPGRIHFILANCEPTGLQEVVLSDLIPGQQYQVRVNALYSYGTSPPSEVLSFTAAFRPAVILPTKPVATILGDTSSTSSAHFICDSQPNDYYHSLYGSIVPRFLQPNIKRLKEITGYINENKLIHIPYNGIPLNRIEITLNDQNCADNTRLSIGCYPPIIELSIDGLKPMDAGVIDLSIANVHGCDTTRIKLSVAGKPNRPTGPLIAIKIGWYGLTLTWQPPADFGGRFANINYTIWKRQVGSNDWIIVTPQLIFCRCLVTGLQSNTQYEFKVTAFNQYGVSDELLSDTITTSKPMFKPTVPLNIKGIPVGPSKTCITWDVPENPGNALIVAYAIQYKFQIGGVWQRPITRKIKRQFYMLSFTSDVMAYKARVKALNNIGWSRYGSVRYAIRKSNPDNTPSN